MIHCDPPVQPEQKLSCGRSRVRKNDPLRPFFVPYFGCFFCRSRVRKNDPLRLLTALKGREDVQSRSRVRKNDPLRHLTLMSFLVTVRVGVVLGRMIHCDPLIDRHKEQNESRSRVRKNDPLRLLQAAAPGVQSMGRSRVRKNDPLRHFVSRVC